MCRRTLFFIFFCLLPVYGALCDGADLDSSVCTLPWVYDYELEKCVCETHYNKKGKNCIPKDCANEASANGAKSAKWEVEYNSASDDIVATCMIKECKKNFLLRGNKCLGEGVACTDTSEEMSRHPYAVNFVVRGGQCVPATCSDGYEILNVGTVNARCVLDCNYKNNTEPLIGFRYVSDGNGGCKIECTHGYSFSDQQSKCVCTGDFNVVYGECVRKSCKESISHAIMAHVFDGVCKLESCEDGWTINDNICVLNSDTNTKFLNAATTGDNETLNLLLSRNDRLAETAKDASKKTALHLAAEKGHLSTVQLLINKGANTEARDDVSQMPIHLAVQARHSDVVEWLLHSGPDVKGKDGKTALHQAIELGYDDVVNTILDAKTRQNRAVNVNIGVQDDNGNTPLHLAVNRSDANNAGKLISADSNIINIKNRDGNTALHLAAYNGDYSIVEKLVNNSSIDLNIGDKSGETALHLAALWGRHSGIPNLLISKGAKVNAADDSNWTPLHFATQQGHDTVVVDLLTKLNSVDDIMKKNNDDDTPLHLAARWGHSTIVGKLLDKLKTLDADNFCNNINMKNKKGKTPYELAVIYGHTDVKDIFVRNTGCNFEEVVVDNIEDSDIDGTQNRDNQRGIERDAGNLSTVSNANVMFEISRKTNEEMCNAKGEGFKWAGTYANDSWAKCIDLKKLKETKEKLNNNFKKSRWKNAEGNFNTARLASDSIAGVALGTVGGIVTNKVVKKNQVKKGFEDIGCYVNGQLVADWGDEFPVGAQ